MEKIQAVLPFLMVCPRPLPSHLTGESWSGITKQEKLEFDARWQLYWKLCFLTPLQFKGFNMAVAFHNVHNRETR